MKIQLLRLLETGTVVAVKVRLSRRNLMTLLAKLDEPGSARTIYQHANLEADLPLIEVTSEEDGRHYQGREPGVVSDRTEATLAGLKQRPETADEYFGGGKA
jgi:hypothetical protein